MVPARKPATIEITKVSEPRARSRESKAGFNPLLLYHFPVGVNQLDITEPKLAKAGFDFGTVADNDPDQIFWLHDSLGGFFHVLQLECQDLLREGFKIIFRQTKPNDFGN